MLIQHWKLLSNRFFDENGEQTHVRDFEVPGKYQLADRFGSFELLGDRVTKLGTNMYVLFYILTFLVLVCKLCQIIEFCVCVEGERVWIVRVPNDS